MRQYIPILNAIFVFLFCFPIFINAQITGTISSTNGDTLSFASIYIKGTSIGTSSNLEGNYQLELKPGNYKLVFQYVGYESHIENIKVGTKPMELNVSLKSQSYELKEITVTANGEDPAYSIIRNAIANRKYYKDLLQEYQCRVYVKGNQKVLSIPEKILGQEIGDLDGMLDSTRKGIVYLSETISDYYFKNGESKEVIISSKLSGNDSGYSFNSAQEMEFNIYENSFSLNREIVSPIANNALSYYKYKLEGSFYNSDQLLINKIKIWPKRKSDPAVEGYIYIIEDLWNVHSFRVNLPKEATQLPFLDSLVLNQVYVPIQDPDVYKLFSNTISFELKLFGVHLDGKFSAVYSDYKINPDFSNVFFNNEVYKVEKESNERTYEYWDSIRPVPLTSEENLDYIKKDSLQIIRKSPAYLDSIDRVNNKFKPLNLLFGYSHQNSQKKSRISIGSVLDNLQFNTVQGYNVNPEISYSKYFDEEETKRLKLSSNFNYGFSEKRYRINGKIEYLFNKINFSRLSIKGGHKISQFDNRPAISAFENTLYGLFFRRNWAKYYDKKYFSINYEQELFNGLYLINALEYSDRFSLANTSDLSYFYQDSRIYTANDVSTVNKDFGEFSNHKIITYSLDARIRFDQKYYSYPDRKFTYGSKHPDIWIHLRQGVYAINTAPYFTHIAMTLRDKVNCGVYGQLDYRLNAGFFINQDDLSIVDYKHFHGDQTFLSNPENYNSSFLLLPYYFYSTRDKYIQGHLQYHFNGWIMDKIPGLNKLAWQLIAGAKTLNTPDVNYQELHIGVDKIGVGIFRIFRLDFVWSFEDFNHRDFGLRLGIGFDN